MNMLILLLALQDVQADVEKLSIGTAWSRIPWKTCVVEAYDQARKENKPVLIWALGGDPEGRC